MKLTKEEKIQKIKEYIKINKVKYKEIEQDTRTTKDLEFCVKKLIKLPTEEDKSETRKETEETITRKIHSLNIYSLSRLYEVITNNQPYIRIWLKRYPGKITDSFFSPVIIKKMHRIYRFYNKLNKEVILKERLREYLEQMIQDKENKIRKSMNESYSESRSTLGLYFRNSRIFISRRDEGTGYIKKIYEYERDPSEPDKVKYINLNKEFYLREDGTLVLVTQERNKV